MNFTFRHFVCAKISQKPIMYCMLANRRDFLKKLSSLSLCLRPSLISIDFESQLHLSPHIVFLFPTEKPAKHANVPARTTRSTMSSCKMSRTDSASRPTRRHRKSSRRSSATHGRRPAFSPRTRSNATSICCRLTKCQRLAAQAKSIATSSSPFSCRVRTSP